MGAPSLPDTYHKAGVDSPTTRSAEIGSLLAGVVEPDWERVRTWQNDEIFGTEVAARLKHPVDYATLIQKRGDTVSLTLQPPHVWILLNEHRETGEMGCLLATLLPDESYEGDASVLGSNPEGSDFYGLAIYSRPDGTPLWGQRFEDGEIVNSLEFDSKYEDEADPDITIRMGITAGAETRTWVIIQFPGGNIYMYYIEDIIVTPPKDEEETLLPKDWGGGGGENNNNGPDPGGTGDGNPSSDNDNDNNEMFTLTLSTHPAEGGTVSGGGTYPANTNVRISATANPGYTFNYWMGDFTAPYAEVSINLTRDLTFTAGFTPFAIASDPCSDLENGKANPVVNMELAPPSTSNIAGATYGDTRDGGKSFHDGIDLAGEVGTPIYSQFDGTIGKVVDEQPNKIKSGKDYVYPTDYSGDKNNAGNRIYVNSTIDGKTVSNGYWHLQAETPIAENPRTGSQWATGDTINAGELIGYIGITGNANPNVPHLHLNTKVGGDKTDPADYLNATISTSTVDITTPCD